MQFANLFYLFPRLSVLAIGFILVTGTSAFLNLPRQEDPTMTERFGSVETFLPGATAERVETLVTEKVENALREVPEVKIIASTSRSGYSNIQVELYDEVNASEVNLVWSEIRDKVGEIETYLPASATTPRIEAITPAAVTLAIAITSDVTPISVLERIATELRTRLSSLPGTRETEVFGEPLQEVLVEVDQQRLARANIPMPQLMQTISASDTKVGAGGLDGQDYSLVVEVKGELTSVERISSIPLPGSANGQFLRLSDVAHVYKHYVDPPESIAILNDKRGILVTTTMETGRRVDHWVEAGKKIIAEYDAELPELVELDIIVDQNYYTQERLTTLLTNLLLAILLVLIALFFLMGLRSAFIVGSAIPMTMAMVLVGLYALDIPLHQMSVTGLIIALGLLIDNAIVVVEEFKMKRRDGADIASAISKSVRHLFVPLLASTATTAFAFLPIAMTPGGVGDFTGAMAIAVVLSVSGSFVLAMTIIPTVAGFVDRYLPSEADSDHWWVNGYTPKHLIPLYEKVIKTVCEKPLIGVGASIVLPIIGFLVAGTMTTSFFPPVDRNQFQVQVSMPAGTSLSQTLEEVNRAREYLAGVPEIVESHWFVGEDSPPVYYNMLGNSDGVSSFANGFVTTAHVDDPRVILPDLQKALMKAFPRARIMALPFEQGPPFTAPIEIRIVGPDLVTLRNLGDEIRLVLSDTIDVTYTTATLSGNVAQVSVYPNENMTRMLGLSNQQIPQQLNNDLSGLIAANVMEGSTEIPVRVRLDSSAGNHLGEINSLPILRGNSGGNTQSGYAGIPLEQIASIRLEPSPTRIDRYQNERINMVSGFLLPYAFPSEAVKDFRNRMEQHNITLPPGYRIEFGGEEEKRGAAVNNIMATFLTFLWLMVVVIVLSLNSFRHALIIGLVGFLSVGLALLGVWMSGYPLGYTALIGTLGLVGLAINGAIIVLSALRGNESAMAGDITATTRVVVNSSRHIISTTVTTIGGFIPLIIFGGNFWPPLAMAIAGGVAGSAILALILVPALFCWYIRRDQRHVKAIPQLV
jgi:multidrug efflux pump subunit AcrB